MAAADPEPSAKREDIYSAAPPPKGVRRLAGLSPGPWEPSLEAVPIRIVLAPKDVALEVAPVLAASNPPKRTWPAIGVVAIGVPPRPVVLKAVLGTARTVRGAEVGRLSGIPEGGVATAAGVRPRGVVRTAPLGWTTTGGVIHAPGTLAVLDTAPSVAPPSGSP